MNRTVSSGSVTFDISCDRAGTTMETSLPPIRLGSAFLKAGLEAAAAR